MSSDGTLEPQYGVKTCGKRAERPFDMLGPCLLEPGHDDKCEFQAPGLPTGRISISKVEMPQLGDHPWYSDAEVMKYRKISKRLFRGSLVALTFNLLVSVWQILQLFNVI